MSVSTSRPFSHTPAGPVLGGVGVASTVGTVAALAGRSRIAVLTDSSVRQAGLVDGVLASLGDRCVFVYDSIVADGDCAAIEQLAQRARDEHVDAVVSVGGGSVIDSAKGLLAVLATDKTLAALEGYRTINAALLPHVAIPTTAGTGAEATQFAVIKDRAALTKRVFVDPVLIPSLAVLDPTLLVGLPAAVSSATAVDALTHALEAVASKLANPIGTTLATEAARLLLVDRALARSLHNPNDLDARFDCLMAAHLAGQAVNTAMLGACHALGHVVGAATGLPHGVANGLFIVAVLRENAEKAGAAYARLGRSLGIASAGDDVAALIAVVDDFVHGTAGIARRLRDAAPALQHDALEALAAAALRDPDLPTNPVRFDAVRLLSVLQRQW
jgi:alcohol dehydrogenase class IV